jgi:hypothetical protein
MAEVKITPAKLMAHRSAAKASRKILFISRAINLYVWWQLPPIRKFIAVKEVGRSLVVAGSIFNYVMHWEVYAADTFDQVGPGSFG